MKDLIEGGQCFSELCFRPLSLKPLVCLIGKDGDHQLVEER